MVSQALFRACSRIVVATYGRFPLFGELRSSIAVLRRGERYLLQQRADGLGWAFPGGMSWFWETEEQTLRREVKEETGLEITRLRREFVYHDRHYLPSRIAVFACEASGEPRGSWEGEPRWMPLPPREAFFAAQLSILDRVRDMRFPL
ncbi:MAG TPA: NUDIX domain-containing protein [Terriglobales bacterium]|nr:NUDIX domain-containing protein [Terriglobales bacterium]